MSTRPSTSRASSTIASTPSLWVASLVCLLATSFLLYSFILQVSPSVITRELTYEFRLNKMWLGIVIGCCSYTYALFQVPAGMLLDRFGPRKLLTAATLACAVGALLFGHASSWIMLSLGRLLVGASSAFAFTGALIVVANWFPPRYFSILAGIVQFASSIGAIAGQRSLVPFIHQLGWRTTTNYLGYIGLGLGLLIWLVVRDAPNQKAATSTATKFSWKVELKKLSLVLHNPQTWWIGLYVFAVWMPISAFAGFWGVPFLRSTYGLREQAASTALAFAWLGVGIGSPLLGIWSNNIKQRKLPLTLSAIVGVISWFALVYVRMPLYGLYLNLFIIGLAAAGQVLSFAAVKENNRPEVTGTAAGINNTAVVSGSVIFLPLLGSLFEMGTQSFLVLPLFYLIAVLISQFLIKETNCKSRYAAR